MKFCLFVHSEGVGVTRCHVKFVAACVYVQDGKIKLSKLLTKRHSSQKADVTYNLFKMYTVYLKHFSTQCTTLVRRIQLKKCARCKMLAVDYFC